MDDNPTPKCVKANTVHMDTTSSQTGIMHVGICSMIMCVLLLVNSIPQVYSLPSTDNFYQTSSSSGEQLICQKCQRGSYKIGDCTSDWGLSECLPCPKRSYMPVLNTADRCIKCRQGCPGNTGATQTQTMGACTSTSDITCTCIDGYYEIDDGELCLPWTRCYPGTGVRQTGTSKTNTVCEPCPEKTFSNNTSLTEPCNSCRKCNATEEADLKSCGDGKSDRICVPLQNNIFPHAGGTTSTPLPDGVCWLLVGIVIGIATVVALIVITRRYNVTLSDLTSKLIGTCFGRTKESTPPMELHAEDRETTTPMITTTSTCHGTASMNQPVASADQSIASADQPIASADQLTVNIDQSTASAFQSTASADQSIANHDHLSASVDQPTASVGLTTSSTSQATLTVSVRRAAHSILNECPTPQCDNNIAANNRIKIVW